MQKNILCTLLALTLTGFELSAQDQHDHPGPQNTPAKAAVNPALGFSKQLAAVFTASQDLKEAFVAADAAKVKTAAAATQGALAGTDAALLKGDAPRKVWLDFQQTLEQALAQMSACNDVQAQRQSFARFSEALYKSLKTFGTGGTEVYYQHCPMALNHTGGSWLSNSKLIRNPYFGNSMLRCGATKETLN
ncbi:MAG: DUF3347 domain-containing protein [Adhaeribacter sp.]